VRGADRQWNSAEGVAEHHSNPITAGANVHDLANGLVAEVQRRLDLALGLGALGLRGLAVSWLSILRLRRLALWGPCGHSRRPGADPVQAASAALCEPGRIDREHGVVKC
jgi:hypothetical protein